MSRLHRADYEGLITFAEAVVGASCAMEWWEVFACLALGPLLSADVVAVAVIDYGAAAQGMFSLVRPAWAELSVASGSEMHRDLLDSHPFTPHIHGPDACDVVRISDLVPETRWRSMAGFSKMQELIGATYQVSIALTMTSTRSIAATPIRARDDFTEREVEICRHFQRLLAAADRHSQTQSDQRDRLLESGWSGADAAAEATGLTSRERVVLGLLADGHTAQSAARALLVSPRTVSKHQQNLYRKLGVVDRLSAVLRAQHLGLVPHATRPRV